MAKVTGKFNAVFFKNFPEGYEDRSGKNRKGVFRKIGNAVSKDDGSLSVFLDSVPFDWDGQLKLYPVDDEKSENGAEPEPF